MEGGWGGREGGREGREGGREGGGGREGRREEGRDDCYTYSSRYVQYQSNAMIPEYLNNNLT